MISALFCVYNDHIFTGACLKSIEPFVDQIVIVEGSWDGQAGTYDYKANKRSDDGTLEIVEKFAKDFSHKTILVNSIGDECITRNYGLSLCTEPMVLHLDSDEFYYPDQLLDFRQNVFWKLDKDADVFTVDSMGFVFNFRRFFKGPRARLFRNNGVFYTYGQAIGDVLDKEGGVKYQHVNLMNLHFQMVGNRSKIMNNNMFEREKELQVFMGEDPSIPHLGGYRWWHENVFLKYDGTNLEELEEKCKGSIHVWSYHHEEHRDHKLHEIPDDFVWPAYLYQETWFNPDRKDRIEKLEPTRVV